MSDAVAIVGAGAVSAYGVGWRGLGKSLVKLAVAPSVELAASHPGVLCSSVSEVPSRLDAGDARARKLMSRAARLGAIAMREALDGSRRLRRRDAGRTVHPRRERPRRRAVARKAR